MNKSKKITPDLNSISTRKKVRELAEKSKVIDFSNVNFLSRAPAQELVKLKKERGLEFVNLNGNPKLMIEKVK